MKVVEVKHPLVRHKLGLLREATLDTRLFRELVSEIAMMLAYEATADLPLETAEVECWSGPLTVPRLDSGSLTVVPILRAGLGMMNGVLDLLPGTAVSVVGLYRDEHTLEPVAYFEKLVSALDERLALVVDPMLATGGSMIAALDLLKRRGCRQLRALVLVAAPEGLQALQLAHPDVEVYTAVIDAGLNERGYILPGLGDAGDRIFGTL